MDDRILNDIINTTIKGTDQSESPLSEINLPDPFKRLKRFAK